MRVKKILNKILSSNSYIIHNEEEKSVWIVDAGDSDQLLDWIIEKKKNVSGILLTHSHIDHIYGVNDICKRYSNLNIYISEQALVGLYSAKANGSYYMEMPYTVDHDKIIIVNHKDEIKLNVNNSSALVIYTPGHNNDCISFIVKENIFTGDALIPGKKVHTRSKYSNKKLVNNSICEIISYANKNARICPGHGDMIFLKEFDIDDTLSRNIN